MHSGSTLTNDRAKISNYYRHFDANLSNLFVYKHVIINIKAIKSKFHYCKTKNDRETLILVLFHIHAKQKLRTLNSYTKTFYTYIIIQFDVIMQMSNSQTIHTHMKILRKFVLYRRSTFFQLKVLFSSLCSLFCER